MDSNSSGEKDICSLSVNITGLFRGFLRTSSLNSNEKDDSIQPGHDAEQTLVPL